MAGIHLDLREIHQVGKRTLEFLVHPDHCPALRKHGIFLTGMSMASPGFRFVRHQPDTGQILVCFRGEGSVLIEGRWRKCGAGTAYITPPGILHAYHAGRQWEVGWVTYTALPVFTMKEPVLRNTDPRPLEYVLQGLHLETMVQREPAVLDSWVELLHSHALRIVEARRTSRLWRVWDAVQAALDFPWTLPELAKLACLGPERLRKVCLLETGHSPMQHVGRLRMRHAVSLLGMGQKVETVAHSVGYDNAFAFASAFKRIMGRIPSAFRRHGAG